MEDWKRAWVPSPEGKGKDGSVGYRAEVVRKRVGLKLVETFDRRKAAQDWIDKREKELDQPGGSRSRDRTPRKDRQDRPSATRSTGLSPTGSNRWADNQRQSPDSQAPQDRRHCLRRRHQPPYSRPCPGALRGGPPPSQPSVTSSRASGRSLRVADPMWGYPLDEREMAEGRRRLSRARSDRAFSARKRRPELDELDRLMEHFQGTRGDGATPCRCAACPRSGYSACAASERPAVLLWKDYEPDHKDGPRILVRDMKHPGEKVGNDVWCRLTTGGRRDHRCHAADRRPHLPLFVGDGRARTSPGPARSFGSKTSSTATFAATASRGLLEMGKGIAVVREFSGHRTLSSLEHYVSLKKIHGDKYEGWRWLAAVTGPLTRVKLPHLLHRAARR